MIGLTQISGRTGKLIRFGQWLNGEGFTSWEHAFVCLPGNLILEAEPGGAIIRPFHYTGADVYWCENIYKLLPPGISDAEFTRVGESLKGTPYSFLDYLALATHRLRIPGPFLKNYVQTSAHEICSQLSDDYYWRLGTQIFTDKRWPGYVTPASLYKRDLELSVS